MRKKFGEVLQSKKSRKMGEERTFFVEEVPKEVFFRKKEGEG